MALGTGSMLAMLAGAALLTLSIILLYRANHKKKPTPTPPPTPPSVPCPSQGQYVYYSFGLTSASEATAAVCASSSDQRSMSQFLALGSVVGCTPSGSLRVQWQAVQNSYPTNGAALGGCTWLRSNDASYNAKYLGDPTINASPTMLPNLPIIVAPSSLCAISSDQQAWLTAQQGGATSTPMPTHPNCSVLQNAALRHAPSSLA